MNIKYTYCEALDLPEGDSIFHPTKKSMVEDTIHDVEEIMPTLGPNAQRYLELITSNSYKKLLERLELYVGQSITSTNLPAVLQSIMTAYEQIVAFESAHVDQLSELALNVVLSLPEFQLIKKRFDSGDLHIDAKLDKPDLSRAQMAHEVTPDEAQPEENQPEPVENVEEPKGDLEADEQANFEIANELVTNPNGALKRKLANFVTQGNAVQKLFLFNLVVDQLNNIDRRLVGLYGLLTAGVQVSYYITPVIVGVDLRQAAVGSEEVSLGKEGDDNSGIYTIKARGSCFPYLVHEIVKGIYDYLTMDIASDADLAKETIDQEILEIMAGPDLYKSLSTLIPQESITLTPLIFKNMFSLSKEQITQILGGGNRAQTLMRELINISRQQLEEYEGE